MVVCSNANGDIISKHIRVQRQYLTFSCDCLCAGDAGANSGEDIQLTTTITHVDGPTEIYKMTGKEAQE